MVKRNVLHIRNSKQALNHGLPSKKIHRGISFNQGEWLKPYIEINNKLRTEAKNYFDKEFFQTNEQFCFWKDYGECKKA